MISDADISVVTQLTNSAIIVYVVQQLKKFDWIPLIHENSTKINRLVALVLAGLNAMAVHWTTEGTFVNGQTIIITIPAASVLFHGLWGWAQSFITQELIYQGTVNRAHVVVPEPVAKP